MKLCAWLNPPQLLSADSSGIWVEWHPGWSACPSGDLCEPSSFVLHDEHAPGRSHTPAWPCTRGYEPCLVLWGVWFCAQHSAACTASIAHEGETWGGLTASSSRALVGTCTLPSPILCIRSCMWSHKEHYHSNVYSSVNLHWSWGVCAWLTKYTQEKSTPAFTVAIFISYRRIRLDLLTFYLLLPLDLVRAGKERDICACSLIMIRIEGVPINFSARRAAPPA